MCTEVMSGRAAGPPGGKGKEGRRGNAVVSENWFVLAIVCLSFVLPDRDHIISYAMQLDMND